MKRKNVEFLSVLLPVLSLLVMLTLPGVVLVMAANDGNTKVYENRLFTDLDAVMMGSFAPFLIFILTILLLLFAVLAVVKKKAWRKITTALSAVVAILSLIHLFSQVVMAGILHTANLVSLVIAALAIIEFFASYRLQAMQEPMPNTEHNEEIVV